MSLTQTEMNHLINLTAIDINGKEINLFEEARSFWQSPAGKKAIAEAMRRQA